MESELPHQIRTPNNHSQRSHCLKESVYASSIDSSPTTEVREVQELPPRKATGRTWNRSSLCTTTSTTRPGSKGGAPSGCLIHKTWMRSATDLENLYVLFNLRTRSPADMFADCLLFCLYSVLLYLPYGTCRNRYDHMALWRQVLYGLCVHRLLMDNRIRGVLEAPGARPRSPMGRPWRLQDFVEETRVQA